MPLNRIEDVVSRSVDLIMLHAINYGWTEIDSDMTGIPPIGPKVRKPIPVPGLESSKGPHRHCTQCWAEEVDENGVCLKCQGESIMCFPAFCGSS